MKQLAISFFALSSFALCAQSPLFQVLAPAGDVAETGNIRMYYTVGEPFIELYTKDANTLASGFQQPMYGVVASHEPGAESVQVNLWPNPTSDVIFWEIEGAGKGLFSWRLFDAPGALLRQGDAEIAGALDLSVLPSGNYILLFSDKKGALLPKRFLIAR